MPYDRLGASHCNPPVNLVGTETIRLFNASGGLVMEASVLGAQPDTALRLPVYEKNGFGTGVAFNLGSVNSTTNMTLRGKNGVTIISSPIELTPSQQTARFVSELFPGVTNFEGTLELRGSRSMAAIAVRIADFDKIG